MVPLLKTNKEKNLKNNLIVLTDKCLCYFYFFLKEEKIETQILPMEK